jgi:hypothetical protein
LGLGIVALAAAAAGASTLSMISGGLWEVDGGPSGRVRQCVADPRLLAQVEHRRESCPQTLISSSDDSSVIQYNCPSGGFGRSDVKVLTPRSLRIETQGISGGLPFRYVLQARRLGDCAGH